MNNARILKNRTASTRARRSGVLRVRELRRGGFTLIEILVALVVFVVGALAIVRIFPPALGVIQNSENRTVATNLSKGTLAAYENDPALIPSAVYEIGAPDDVAVVGNINTNKSLPGSLLETTGDVNNPGFAESALGHFKIIQGETQRILMNNAPSTPQRTTPQRYVLTQFPYDWGTGNDAKAYVEDRVDGVRVYTNNDPTVAPVGSGVLDFSNAKLASDSRAFNDIDYRWADGSIGTRTATPGTNRRLAPREWTNPDLTRFYVSYNWFDGNRVQGVVDEPLNPVPSTPPVVAPFAPQVKASGIAGKAVVDGPIALRVRRRVSTYNAPADPPNEQPRADAMRGYLPLVFTNADDLRRSNQLVYPSVSLTYAVSDWRWLVEDTTLIPTNAPFTDVTVPMRFIDGDNLNDKLNNNPAGAGSVFTLTFDAPDTATPPVANVITSARWNGADPTALNGTGLVRVSNDTNTVPNPLTDEDVFVNAKKGLVHFDAAAGGQRARVVYWTTDQWVRQLSVAAQSYTPWYNVSATINASSEPWREYYWNNTSIASNTSANVAARGSIYFRPSEVGKTVVVNFEYWKDLNSDNIEQANEFVNKTAPMTIEDETVAAPTFLSGFGNTSVAQLKLNDPTLAGGGAYNVKAIRAVRGASVMVRTAWADGGRYQQEVTSTYRPLDEN